MTTPTRSWENIVNSLDGKITIIGTPAEFVASSAKLPRPHFLLYANFYASAEINNGGFSQLFYNSTGLIAPEAREGFAAIGMPRISTLFDQAMKIFGSPYPRASETRRQALELIAPRFLFGTDWSKSTRRYSSPFEVITSDALLRDTSDKSYQLEYAENGGLDKAATNYAYPPPKDKSATRH